MTRLLLDLNDLRVVWALVASLLLGLPLSTHAAGAYVGVGTGLTYAPNERLEETPVLLDYDFGLRAASVGAGYAFDTGWRLELEGAYRTNDVEIIEFADARGMVNTDKNDAVKVSSLMLNALYEFDWGVGWQPYLGIGAGVGRLKYRLTDTGSGARVLDDRASPFVFQLLAGVRVPLGRRLHLTADYRYWRSARFTLATALGERVRTDHPLHQANLGLRYAFNPTSAPRRTPADAGRRWYSDVRLGAVVAEDSDIEDGLRDTNFDAFDLGSALAVALGRAAASATGRGWRAELELYRWANEADVIDFGKFRGEFRLGGEVETVGVSANLLYDFAGGAVLRPYVGLGVGLARVDYAVTLREGGAESEYLDDADGGFAAQALLGVSARLTQRVRVSVNYRYWWAPFVKPKSPDGATWDTEHSAHVLQLGVRYRLGRGR